MTSFIFFNRVRKISTRDFVASLWGDGVCLDVNHLWLPSRQVSFCCRKQPAVVRGGIQTHSHKCRVMDSDCNTTNFEYQFVFNGKQGSERPEQSEIFEVSSHSRENYTSETHKMSMFGYFISYILMQLYWKQSLMKSSLPWSSYITFHWHSWKGTRVSSCEASCRTSVGQLLFAAPIPYNGSKWHFASATLGSYYYKRTWCNKRTCVLLYK